MSKVQRAILSVTDKTGLVDFARKLSALGIELISTGGTAKLLRDSGVTVKDISELTGFPEMLDGRVKTLHPKVHGGILHRREDPKHVAAVAEHGIAPIDMVVVNLYAFEKTAAKPGVAFEELIENIDIGGPSMIRSAAKNFQRCRHRDFARRVRFRSPMNFPAPAARCRRKRSGVSRKKPLPPRPPTIPPSRRRWSVFRRILSNFSRKAPRSPPSCDSISTKLSTCATARTRTRKLPCTPTAPAWASPMGASFRARNFPTTTSSTCRPHGISRRNLRSQSSPSSSTPIPAAPQLARRSPKLTSEPSKCDPVSAFGGVIGVNRPVDAEAAEEMHKLFLEVIAAPGFDEAAKAKFASKKNLRLVQVAPANQKWVLKDVSGGMLVQDADSRSLQEVDLKVVTKRAPTPEETRAMLFAWKVCKHVKSNAIVYARDGQTVGVGAGQMSRVDAAKIGAMKAQLPLQGTVAASDAFFPFPDGVEEIAKTGATAIIQPGGSQRDPEVIAAADRLGLAMLFTGVRHFRH